MNLGGEGHEHSDLSRRVGRGELRLHPVCSGETPNAFQEVRDAVTGLTALHGLPQALSAARQDPFPARSNLVVSLVDVSRVKQLPCPLWLLRVNEEWSLCRHKNKPLGVLIPLEFPHIA